MKFEDSSLDIETGCHIIPVKASEIREALILIFATMGFDKELLKDKDFHSMSWIACGIPGSTLKN